MRNITLLNNEYYHIFNRGNDKRQIFFDEGDYKRFLNYISRIIIMDNQTKLSGNKLSLLDSIEFISYCLIPNHFHFILKQLKDNGISDFMHYLGTSYTMYFNTKYEKSGSLFQGPFKSIHVDSEEYLYWLSIYINGNSQIHGIVSNAGKYPWSSYQEYLGLTDENLCNKEVIFNQANIDQYKEYVGQCIPLIKEKKMSSYLME